MTTTSRCTRLSVNINEDSAAQLRRMAERDGITITEAVRRVVAVYKFFEVERARGAQVRLVGRCGEVRDVQFLLGAHR